MQVRHHLRNFSYKLDKKTRDDLVATIKRVAVEILEGPKETWLTGDEVTKTWPFFTKDWMKKHAYLLPRKRIVTVDRHGAETEGRWFYPRNKILRMVQEEDILYFEDIKYRD